MRETCTGKTIEGRLCKHVALPESNYCAIHEPEELDLDLILERIYVLAGLE